MLRSNNNNIIIYYWEPAWLFFLCSTDAHDEILTLLSNYLPINIILCDSIFMSFPRSNNIILIIVGIVYIIYQTFR